MAIALNPKQEERLLEVVLAGPQVPLGGRLGDLADRVTKFSEVSKLLVGRMKVAGFSLYEILSVLTLIGGFILEHGDDIEAIWKKIVSLFPKKADMVETEPPAE